MSDLFIEFYSEEIPSRMQEPSSKSLKESLFKALNENRFSFSLNACAKDYLGEIKNETFLNEKLKNGELILKQTFGDCLRAT